MSDTQFHETRMGRTFFEHTLPRLVEQLERLNENLERLASRLEYAGRDRVPSVDSECGETAAPESATDTVDQPDADRPPVVLVGEDGNAFSILGRCVRAARAAGWGAERIAAFRDEATGGDYDHLLALVQKHFDVR